MKDEGLFNELRIHCKLGQLVGLLFYYRSCPVYFAPGDLSVAVKKPLFQHCWKMNLTLDGIPSSE